MIGSNGVLTSQINETVVSPYYDGEIHIEPDNSLWFHIFHHDNPVTYKFASTDDFRTGVYTDDHRWFNAAITGKMTKWEFLAVQKPTTDGAVSKWRWVQNANPMTATYNQVAPSTVTRVTDGYSTGTHGGIYVLNSNTYMVQTDGTNGNWWGATGCWTAHNGGIPGYEHVVVTTGSMDLYVRIDNGGLTNEAWNEAKVFKSGVCVGHEFYEI